jgi:uncharacterized RDD family membrane protein YckC
MDSIKSFEDIENQKTREIILATRASRLAAKLLDTFFLIAIIFIGLVIASISGKMSFADLYIWILEWILEKQTGEISSSVNYNPGGFQIFLIILSFIAVIMIQGKLLIRDGQTIGKKIIGIKIINAYTLGKVKWFNIIFIRWIFFGILSVLPYVGNITLFMDVVFIFSKNRKCIHDMLSGTVVAKKTDDLN